MMNDYMTTVENDADDLVLDAEMEEDSPMDVSFGEVFRVEAEAEIDKTPTAGSENAVSSGGVYDALGQKMDKTNPSGTGSFSLNRKAGTTVGEQSVAMGEDNEASGRCAYCEGYNSIASGIAAHAEGYMAKATSAYSHAEGNKAKASAWCSHAEGNNTIANSKSQHVEGDWNVEDPTPNETARGTYLHIAGNGSKTKRSNAHTLDWKGNAWFSGDVYVRSASGTNRDEGSKKLATTEDVEALAAKHYSGEITLDATSASLTIPNKFGTEQYLRVLVWTEFKDTLYSFEVVACDAEIYPISNAVYYPMRATYVRHDSTQNNGTMYTNLALKINFDEENIVLTPSATGHKFYANVPYKYMVNCVPYF